MKITRFIAFLSAVILFTVPAMSADVSFSVKNPGTVTVGEKYNVTFVVRNGEVSGQSVKAPQISGSSLIFGPSTARMQSYQVINGVSQSSSSIEFNFIYKAEKEGKQTIPAQTITIGGKKYSSSAVSFNVIGQSAAQKAAAAAAAPGSSRPVSIDDASTQSSDRAISGNDVFIRISTSRSSAYEQEAIECTIKLFTKYNITEFMTLSQPTFDGFLVEDLPIQADLNQRETINGQTYATAVVKKCILFPQKAGKLTINSGTYNLKVVQYDNVNVGFYTVQQPRERTIKVNSNSASVQVQALPDGAPAGFDGAVGQFSATSKMSTNSFRTNEPATLSYVVTGVGNIRYIKDPEVDFPTEFEQYTPQHSVDANVEGNNVRGKSTTEITFIPKEVGSYEIRVPDFVYFDPAKKEYVTIPGTTYNVKVNQGVALSVDQKEISSKNTDILFIKTGDKGQTKNHSFAIDSFGYWFVYILVIALVAGAIVFKSTAAKRSADITGLRKSKANKVARKRLATANKFMNENNREKFYEETLKALWGYLSDKLSIPVADLSRATIETQLLDRHASEATVKDLISVLDQCEMARYTPATGSDELSSIYNRATSIINSLEKTKLS